ncbi:MAG: hypothetical protein RL338_958 [Chloroflexota bacterium]|jgi:acetolactate synthase-1/2/3 large subunit
MTSDERDADGAVAPDRPTGSAEADAVGDAPVDDADAAAATTAPPRAAPSPMTVGAYVAAALRTAGVRIAFTVPGESFLGLLDALDAAGIRVVAARHEGGAAFMAEAYGKLTGRPAACLGTRAVGVANLSIGIHAARQDSTPLFVIAGQVERANRGREAFQEVELVDTFGGLAKWAAEPGRPAEVPGVLDEAIRRALSGRPGPVLLSLSEDLLDEVFTPSAPPIARRQTPPPPDTDEIARILRLVTAAERPLIVAGGGVLRARATADLVRLAEILEVPVVASWRRPDVFPNDHRLYLGHAGYAAPRELRARLAAADVILAVGTRLNEPTSDGYRVPSRGARWAHVDLEPLRGSPGRPGPTIALAADARSFLRAAVARLAGAVHDAAALDARRVRNEEDRAAWEAAARVGEGAWEGPGVHPGRTISTLRALLPSNAIITTDAGNHAGWAGRGFSFPRPGTFLGTTSGAMGYGLPAAIAASLVHRDRPVVALCGDGGIAMTIAELETAVRERVRPIVVVFDNRRYGTIRMHQERRGSGVGVATELGPVDFAAVAEGFGARGIRVVDDAGVDAAIREALASDRPTLVQLALDPAWVSVDVRPDQR